MPTHPLDIEIDSQETGGDALTLTGFKTQILQSRLVMAAQAVQGITSAFMMFEFMQMRQIMVEDMLQNAQLRVQNSQDRYNESVSKFGPASQEALTAHNELIMAQDSLSRTTERTNMLMQRQYLEIIPMGLQVLTSLVTLTGILLGLETARAGVSVGRGGGGAATGMAMGGGMSFGSIGGVAMGMLHSGGVIPETGLYFLQRGETVNAARGGVTSGSGRSQGGDVFHVFISGPGMAGLNASTIGHMIYEKAEMENRRKFSVKDRAQ